MKILAIGDIVSKPGIEVLKLNLKKIISENNIDFVIANIENIAGNGITKSTYNEIKNLDIDAFTLGNHTWTKLDSFDIVREKKVLRPHNFSKTLPGVGYKIFEKNNKKIGVINLLGRVEMNVMTDNPFEIVDEIINEIKNIVDYIFIDFHTEATAEIKTMGYFVDGKVTAVFGTHTHIQTADEQILQKGTAYISDLGMTGIEDSVLGMQKNIAIKRMLKNVPEKYLPELYGISVISGIIITIDDDINRVINIERFKFKDNK